MTEIAKSPYRHLLDDPDFKRWFHNIRRGSVSYAYEVLRKRGYIARRFGKSPKQLAKMSQKQATNFLLDMVSELESEKKSGRGWNQNLGGKHRRQICGGANSQSQSKANACYAGGSGQAIAFSTRISEDDLRTATLSELTSI